MPTTTIHGLEYPDGSYAAASFYTPWQELADSAEAALIGKVNQQVFTASGTWTKPSGAKVVHVRVVGGGGGGGGGAATTSNAAVGSGGGGGGYAESWLAASACGATEAVTVGAGGAGGSGVAGTAGGASSFGTLAVTGGGAGGAVSTAGTSVGPVSGVAGGTATTGQILVPGGGSSYAFRYSATVAMSSGGGPSHLGMGGRSVNGFSNGTDGSKYGGGGSGATNIDTHSARDGGAGADGVVIVTTLY